MGVQMNTQGQQLGIDMADNFMLMTLFSILGRMRQRIRMGFGPM